MLPLGSTEQHAYLSLETHNILSERLAAEAAERLRVPVLPVLSYHDSWNSARVAVPIAVEDARALLASGCR